MQGVAASANFDAEQNSMAVRNGYIWPPARGGDVFNALPAERPKLGVDTLDQDCLICGASQVV
jgi:hypothetical protein